MQTEEMHTCVACEKELPATEFRVIRGRRVKRCRPCHNEKIYEWRRKNPAKVKAHKHRYHANNKQEINKKVREWQNNNRERTVDLAHMGRARRHGSPVVELVERAVVYERDEGKCHVCGEEIVWSDYQVDHVVPLGDGGHHTYENVRASHRKCNLDRRYRE